MGPNRRWLLNQSTQGRVAISTVEELRQALLEFRDTYNTTWLIERHGYLTPDQFRQAQLQAVAKAA